MRTLRRPRATSCGAPRRPATRTSGAARPTGPTASPRSRSPRPGPSRVRLGTGVVGVFQRGPALLAQQAAALADASGGRFVLGIGASSDRIVEGWNGIPFERPLSQGRRDGRLPASRARRRADRDGFKLEQRRRPVPIVLAALRGKMLRLAVEKADGAFTNFLPISGLRACRRRARRRARRLRAAVPLLLHPGRARADRAARPVHVRLLRDRPGLRRLLSAGSATATRSPRCARPGRRRTVSGRPLRRPWELIEEMFILGTPDEMRDRLDEFVAGGITLPGADADHDPGQARAS